MLQVRAFYLVITCRGPILILIKGTTAGAAVAAEESKPKEETKTKEEVKPKEEKTPASTLKTKRGSVFGSVPFFGKKKDETPKKEEEAPPAVPAKDTTTTKPVSDTAPQLESPVKPEDATPPAAPVVENKDTTKETTEAAVPTAAAVPTTGTKNKDTEKPERKSSESKGGLCGFLKQKEAQHEVSFQSKRIITKGNLIKVS